MQHPESIGKYELQQFLGGGMSHVYRARDTVIDRTVVVKILTDDGCRDQEAKTRFLQEARLAGGIQHDNIVAVYDYGEHEGRPYIVMEFLRGKDLREGIRDGSVGGIPERIKIAMQIAAALEFVHTRGIVHRDIKPENIHIDPTGRIKLMDFGIAKTADMSLTRTGMAMGTPYYMAPEQVSGGTITPLVDIYAYGMLFYELLTGSRGITGETMEQVFFQIISRTLDESELSKAGTPPAVRELVLRCTAKKAEERPQSFKEIVADLKVALDPVAATRIAPVRNPDGATTAMPIPPRTAQGPGGSDSTLALPSKGGSASAKHVESAQPAGRTGMLIGAAALLAVAIGVGAWMFLRGPAQVPGMLYVPAGSYLSGADKKPVTLGAFYIDETEVSNADFAAFCQATGCAAPAGGGDLPVVRVTIAQARAYAKWKGKRLPTANEWERSARGTNGSRYPWGDADDASRANVSDNPKATHMLTPVRSLSTQTPYQMAGNAWEMVEGTAAPSPTAVSLFSGLLTPPPTLQETWIAIRGGSFNTPLAAAVTYEWSPIPERYSSADIGFRCAKDP